MKGVHVQQLLDAQQRELQRLRPLARRAEVAERELQRWLLIAAETQIRLDNLRAERA